MVDVESLPVLNSNKKLVIISKAAKIAYSRKLIEFQSKFDASRKRLFATWDVIETTSRSRLFPQHSWLCYKTECCILDSNLVQTRFLATQNDVFFFLSFFNIFLGGGV